MRYRLITRTIATLLPLGMACADLRAQAAPPRNLPPDLATNVVSDAPTSLRVDEAIERAAARHPLLASKQRESEAASQAVNSARWQQFPSLTISSAAQSGGGASRTLQVEQPVWNGGRINADIKASEARHKAASLAVLEVLQTVLVDVARSFIDTIRMHERVLAAAESVDEHERLLELIQRRANNQVNSASEVVTARVRLQQARTELLQLRNALDNARASLALALDAPPTALKVPDTVLPRWNPTREELIAESLSYSPKLRRLVMERTQLEAEMEARKAAIWPQLVLRHEETFGGRSAASGGRISQTYLALTFQPGAGLSYRSSIAEILARVSASELSRTASERDIRDAMRSDWNEWQTSRDETVVLEQLVASTREVYDSYLRQFAAGRKSWLEVLNARREATQARHSLSDARWSGYLAGLRMEIASGRLLASQQHEAPKTAVKSAP